jgi:hypothetical protein
MASIGRPDRPKNKDYVNSSDFEEWVKKYLLPADTSLECSETDLYGARCGIVHSWRYDSRRSNDPANPTREIHYVFDDNDTIRRVTREVAQNTSSVVVIFFNLLRAFEIGMEHFLKDIETDASLRERVEKRIREEKLIFSPLVIMG